MDMIELGTALRQARIAVHLTQEELAERTGVGRATLSRLENGTINELGIRKVIRICEALGVSLTVTEESHLPTLKELLRGQGRG